MSYVCKGISYRGAKNVNESIVIGQGKKGKKKKKTYSRVLQNAAIGL